MAIREMQEEISKLRRGGAMAGPGGGGPANVKTFAYNNERKKSLSGPTATRGRRGEDRHQEARRIGNDRQERLGPKAQRRNSQCTIAFLHFYTPFHNQTHNFSARKGDRVYKETSLDDT